MHSSDTNKRLADKQKYWLRHSQILTVCRRRTQLLHMRKKMQSESSVPMLNVELLFNKAEHQIRVATNRVKQVYSKLSSKAKECLKFIPTDKNLIEADIVTAFEGLRVHTSHTKPYFWEQSSKPIALTTLIPIDPNGQAHVHKIITTGQTAETDFKTKTSKTWKWECSSEVCRITKDQTKGCAALLRGITTTKSANVTEFYADIDQCQYETRSDSFAYSVHCKPASGCNSLLRPARELSCHFPHLRSMIRRIYDLRSVSCCIRAVNRAMYSGDYITLETAI